MHEDGRLVIHKDNQRQVLTCPHDVQRCRVYTDTHTHAHAHTHTHTLVEGLAALPLPGLEGARRVTVVAREEAAVLAVGLRAPPAGRACMHWAGPFMYVL
jgi:hypothetical protein